MFSILAQNRRRKKLSRLMPRQFFSRNFVTLVGNFEPKLKTWSRQIMFHTKNKMPRHCSCDDRFRRGVIIVSSNYHYCTFLPPSPKCSCYIHQYLFILATTNFQALAMMMASAMVPMMETWSSSVQNVKWPFVKVILQTLTPDLTSRVESEFWHFGTS